MEKALHLNLKVTLGIKFYARKAVAGDLGLPS